MRLHKEMTVRALSPTQVLVVPLTPILLHKGTGLQSGTRHPMRSGMRDASSSSLRSSPTNVVAGRAGGISYGAAATTNRSR